MMRIIDVPVFNPDGSVKFTQLINAEEAQALLQFALNFLASTGMNVRMLVDNQQKEEEVPAKLND